MKKIVLIIAATIMASAAWAQSQQLQTVKGKTKDGKSINVQYYKGTAQDYIESVKYQLVDELKAENKTKQNSINELQSQLSKANKKIDNLNDQLKKADNGGQIDTLNEQLNEKDNEIAQLNEQLEQLQAQLKEKEAENSRLQRQLDSIKEINRQLSLNKKHPDRHPVIGVEGSMGGVVLLGNIYSSPNPWEKALSWNKQATLYFGTGRLSKNIPVSIEAGVGFRSLPMKATINKNSGKIEDIDGDLYEPGFGNCSEKLTMNCLEIPIRLCFGQPDNSKVSVYTKLGVTPSYILSSSLAETYSNKGYYPNWNVTLEGIEELGFIDVDKAVTVTPKNRKINVWGNAIFGAYVPLSSSILFNVGAKLDCPILSPVTFNNSVTSDMLPIELSAGLINYNNWMLIPSLQAGLVYTLK